MAVKNPTSWRRTAESHFLAVSLALFCFASRSGSCSLHCDPGWVCRERVGVAMVRICVDCRAVLGHKCPVCGDARHKLARTLEAIA
jgi:hypothetical protein